MKTKSAMATILVAIVLGASIVGGYSVVLKSVEMPEAGEIITVHLDGSPGERGFYYGSVARDAIAENLDGFWDWAKSLCLSKDDLMAGAAEMEDSQPARMVEELRAMAAGAGVDYLELLAMNLFYSTFDHSDGCTNLVAAGSGTMSGQTLASKNRDASKTNVLLIVEPSQTTHGFVAVAGAGEWGISFGLNDVGLCEGNNWMPVPAYDPNGIGEMSLNRLVLEMCSSVDDAISYVDSVLKHGGSTVMVADSKKAAFIETVPTIFAPDTVAYVMANGAAVHTNHYVYEPFRSWALSGSFGYFWGPSVARFDRATELIEQLEGDLTADLVMSFTRDLEDFGNSKPQELKAAHPEIPDGVWAFGWPGNSICNAATVSAGIFEVDSKYPRLLSTMWMSIYNPAWCMYVPVHNAAIRTSQLATAGYDSYVDGSVWEYAESIRNCEIYEWGDLVPTFDAWEVSWIRQTCSNEDDAARMMKAKRVEEACLFLTEEDICIAQNAYELLQGLPG